MIIVDNSTNMLEIMNFDEYQCKIEGKILFLWQKEHFNLKLVFSSK